MQGGGEVKTHGATPASQIFNVALNDASLSNTRLSKSGSYLGSFWGPFGSDRRIGSRIVRSYQIDTKS